jgi:nicotinamide mononucleotide (NMN) deamidase PncC
MSPGTADQLIAQIREWLKAGAAIAATDPSGKVLEEQPDGTVWGGLTITFTSQKINESKTNEQA